MGARLTAAGALVADWARGAVDAAALLDEGVPALRAETSSRLRSAASLTVAEYLLPRWLIALRTALPDNPHAKHSCRRAVFPEPGGVLDGMSTEQYTDEDRSLGYSRAQFLTGEFSADADPTC